VILNFSVLNIAFNVKEVEKLQCLSLLQEVLSNEADEEVLYRSLVSVGTLIWKDRDSVKLVEELDMLKSIQAQSLSKISKVKEICLELLNYIKHI